MPQVRGNHAKIALLSLVPGTCVLASSEVDNSDAISCGSSVVFAFFFGVFFLIGLAYHGIFIASAWRAKPLAHVLNGALNCCSDTMLQNQPVEPCKEPGNLMIRRVSAVIPLSTGCPAASASLRRL